MTEVTVFVDDAVCGRLPSVCAKEGVVTADHLQMTTVVGGGGSLGPAWLLLLLGPVGWLLLIAILVVRGAEQGEVLSVEVPFSEPAYRRLVAARRGRTFPVAILVVGALGLLGTVLAPMSPTATGRGLAFALLAAVGIGALLTVNAVHAVRAAAVRIRLDASRRWVTLSGVHPHFVAAVAEQDKAWR